MQTLCSSAWIPQYPVNAANTSQSQTGDQPYLSAWSPQYPVNAIKLANKGHRTHRENAYANTSQSQTGDQPYFSAWSPQYPVNAAKKHSFKL